MAAPRAAIFILFNMNINCDQAQESRLWALGLFSLYPVLHKGNKFHLQDLFKG